jgi:hypothetical protein
MKCGADASTRWQTPGDFSAINLIPFPAMRARHLWPGIVAKHVTVAALAACVGLRAEPPAPAPVPGSPEGRVYFSPQRFVGEWCNRDFATGSITRVHIRMEGKKLRVHMWGRCHPKECDWGEAVARPSAGDGNVIEVQWNRGFAIKKQKLTLNVDGTLGLVTNTVYTDHSDRQPQTSVGAYVKGLKHDWSDP